ncbi:ABC transporter [Candidatus Magnetoovum chiemensis]|nr:ABC transporter [Candidatus Magnetoovum chiemensis]
MLTINHQALSSLIEDDKHRDKLVEGLIEITAVCKLIPSQHDKFTQIVYDGISFILLRLSKERFTNLLNSQLLLDNNAASNQRLLHLVKDMPVLYKLGQTIARNKNIDQQFRDTLIKLENGLKTTQVKSLMPLIQQELNKHIALYSIEIDKTLLSEASVAAVVGFTWNEPATNKETNGVLKIIKQHIPKYLNEEIKLINELALYYEDNKNKYILNNFKFIETLKELTEILSKEVNLNNEQLHLQTALNYYSKDQNIKIPKLYDFSTNHITGMEKINGAKITDAALTPKQKLLCCQILTKVFICNCLFSNQEVTIFHADPHAGNIFATVENSETIKIALLDWSIMGRLSINLRRLIIKLALALIAQDAAKIYNSISSLSEYEIDNKNEILNIINDFIEDTNTVNLIKHFFHNALNIIDRIALKGIKFPKDLLIYRKSLFTVTDIINELSSDFNIDEYIIEYTMELTFQEMPYRLSNMFLPIKDSPLNYKSLISNRDMYNLGSKMLLNMLTG